MFDRKTPLGALVWNRCLNISGEIIPGWACVRYSDADPTDGIIEVSKHTEDGSPLWAFNSGTPIEIDEEGECTRTTPAHVLYDDTNTPANGETWGPQAGEWTIAKDKAGLIIVGGTIEDIEGHPRVMVVDSGGGSTGGLSISGAFDAITASCFDPAECPAPTGYSGIEELVFDECQFQLSKPGQAKVAIGLLGGEGNVVVMGGDCCCVQLCFGPGGVFIGTCLVDECPTTACAGDPDCGA